MKGLTPSSNGASNLKLKTLSALGGWDFSEGVLVYKLKVLTDPESAFGYRLAGVEVVEATSPEEARKKLNELINDDTSGIIALSEDFMGGLDERTRARIDQIYRPIVLSIPVKKDLTEVGERREYLSKLIRRAIGFDIKLR